MFYDEFGVYEINKNDKVLHINIYQEEEDWVLYASKPYGKFKIALLRNNMEEFDFDEFFDYSYKYVYDNFDIIIENINTLEQIWKSLTLMNFLIIATNIFIIILILLLKISIH